MNFRMLNRGILSLVLLAASTLTVAAISPECARVQDDVTRPEILGDPTGGAGQTSNYEECEAKCRKDADKLRKKENKRHRKALRACAKDDDSSSSSSSSGHTGGSAADCVQEENELHARILAEIAEDEAACIEACHNQGGGGSSDDDDD